MPLDWFLLEWRGGQRIDQILQEAGASLQIRYTDRQVITTDSKARCDQLAHQHCMLHLMFRLSSAKCADPYLLELSSKGHIQSLFETDTFCVGSTDWKYI